VISAHICAFPILARVKKFDRRRSHAFERPWNVSVLFRFSNKTQENSIKNSIQLGLLKHLGTSPLRSSESLEMAVHEWSRMRESDLYRDEIFKLWRGWEKRESMCSRVTLKNVDASLELVCYI